MRSTIVEIPPKQMKKRRHKRAPRNSSGVIICPQSPPYLTIRSIDRGSMLVQYTDQNGTIAKPIGATELQLFLAIGSEHHAPIADARFYRKFTKSLMTIEFEESADGQVATFYGRWASRDGETGPWSEPLSVRIVGR